MVFTLSLLGFLAGLGMFLFGMQLLESALKTLSSESFRALLRKSTAHSLTSILGGTFTTMVVQSSSMVGLMMMALVGAGVIPLSNAVGVVLGANLGTTFTGWIVATIGFKLTLSTFAVPSMGIGALIRVLLDKRDYWGAWGSLVMGFGALLFGLDIMKTSMEELSTRFDIGMLQGYPAIVYLLVGVVFSAVIQSSSATMMITLSALNLGIVDLPSAAAMVIGADLGTTSTMMLGGIRASAVKKQLALAHVLINVFTAVMAFILMSFLLQILQQHLALTDPLYTLVAFHSTFNLLGIVLILPFLKPFSRFLGKQFLHDEKDVRTYINNTPYSVVGEAIVAVVKEVECLLLRVCVLSLRNLKLSPSALSVDKQLQARLANGLPHDKSYKENYDDIKKLEGEILEYAGQVQTATMSVDQANQLHRLLDAARHGVYAAKSLKDIRENVVMLRHSEKSGLRDYYEQQLGLYKRSLAELLKLLTGEHHAGYLQEELRQLQDRNRESHQAVERRLFAIGLQEGADEQETSTLLNVNREFRASINSLIKAVVILRLKSDQEWFGRDD